MHVKLEVLCDALSGLSDSIINGYSDDRTMNQIWGWNFPCLNRYELAYLSHSISIRIKKTNIDSVPDDLIFALDSMTEKIANFKSSTLPHFFNGNGNTAVVAYLTLMDWINDCLTPLWSWELLYENKLLPNHLINRLRFIEAELGELVPEKNELRKQIDLIRNATQAAESLPTDMQRLKEARSKIEKYNTDASSFLAKIENHHFVAEELAKSISKMEAESSKLVQQCEEAYRITTTKGLAAAFDQRAIKLSNSMWVWVLGLLIALVAAIFIGHKRFELLNKAIELYKNDSAYIALQIIISLFSVAAPVWLAWIATKQIGQRFRLSEDYAFKASVAKAYEGYRKEAARIDAAFESRLFNSALSRLEEPPLRLVESETHGSPWQDFTNSKPFLKAIETIPGFLDQFSKSARVRNRDSKKNGVKVNKDASIEEDQ